MIKPVRFAAVPIALLVLMSCAVPGGAQAPAPAPLVPASPPDVFNASADSLTVLVEYRSADEIQRDLNNATGGQALVLQNLERAKMMETLAENRIKLKQVEIESLNAQIDFAKSQKNESLKKDYETRKKFAETERSLLERRRDLRGQEIAEAKALKEYYEASASTHQVELQLAMKRQQRAALGGAVPAALAQDFARLQAEIKELEKKVLDAQVDEAGRWQKVADRQLGLAKARMNVFKSQAKVEQRR